MSFLQSEGFYVFLGACWLLVLCQSGIRFCRGESSENVMDNGQDSSGLTPEERKQAARQDRRLKILTTILHKKVIAKPDEKEVTLPHEKILSNRSSQSLFDEESLKVTKKDDIFVDKKLNSWRSSRRQLSELSFQTETLYSPKTCAICLGVYKVDEDICWSPNENCHHAFHLDCMMEWLMDNDECPLCRQNYLDSKSES